MCVRQGKLVYGVVTAMKQCQAARPFAAQLHETGTTPGMTLEVRAHSENDKACCGPQRCALRVPRQCLQTVLLTSQQPVYMMSAARVLV